MNPIHIYILMISNTVEHMWPVNGSRDKHVKNNVCSSFQKLASMAQSLKQCEYCSFSKRESPSWERYIYSVLTLLKQESPKALLGMYVPRSKTWMSESRNTMDILHSQIVRAEERYIRCIFGVLSPKALIIMNDPRSKIMNAQKRKNTMGILRSQSVRAQEHYFAKIDQHWFSDLFRWKNNL